MSNDQDLYQESKKAPTLNPNPESDSDAVDPDGIIDLTDVVSEGKDPLELEGDEPLLLDEEMLDLEQATIAEEATPEGMDVASVDAEKPEEVEDVSREDDLSALESSDFKFENEPTFDDADSEPFPEQSQEQLDDVLAGIEEAGSAFEKPEDILADLEKDEPEEPDIEQAEDFLSGYDESAENGKPSDVLAGLEEDQENEKPSDVPAEPEKDQEDEPESAAMSHDIPGFSEEKMKGLLTGIVQEAVSEVAEKVIRDTVEQTIRQSISEIAEKVMNETVDKAIRETVSETAEKVIREAIDTLKQSIASSEL
jgi:hypothetical protein